MDAITLTQERVFSWLTGREEEVTFYRIDVTVTCAGRTASTAFRLELPPGRPSGGRPAPVLLSFDAAVKEYLEAGFAVLTIPAGDITDDRNDPWSGRGGFMRYFYPYDRSSVREIGNEMAAAWECSIAIDVLERLVSEQLQIGDTGTADKRLAPDKLAVTGFFICGKYAFVSACFDERIGVCIPSAAGLHGPVPVPVRRETRRFRVVLGRFQTAARFWATLSATTPGAPLSCSAGF